MLFKFKCFFSFTKKKWGCFIMPNVIYTEADLNFINEMLKSLNSPYLYRPKSDQEDEQIYKTFMADISRQGQTIYQDKAYLNFNQDYLTANQIEPSEFLKTYIEELASQHENPIRILYLLNQMLDLKVLYPCSTLNLDDQENEDKYINKIKLEDADLTDAHLNLDLFTKTFLIGNRGCDIVQCTFNLTEGFYIKTKEDENESVEKEANNNKLTLKTLVEAVLSSYPDHKCLQEILSLQKKLVQATENPNYEDDQIREINDQVRALAKLRQAIILTDTPLKEIENKLNEIKNQCSNYLPELSQKEPESIFQLQSLVTSFYDNISKLF